jgi:hypothetical protein
MGFQFGAVTPAGLEPVQMQRPVGTLPVQMRVRLHFVADRNHTIDHQLRSMVNPNGRLIISVLRPEKAN